MKMNLRERLRKLEVRAAENPKLEPLLPGETPCAAIPFVEGDTPIGRVTFELRRLVRLVNGGCTGVSPELNPQAQDRMFAFYLLAIAIRHAPTAVREQAAEFAVDMLDRFPGDAMPDDQFPPGTDSPSVHLPLKDWIEQRRFLIVTAHGDAMMTKPAAKKYHHEISF